MSEKRTFILAPAPHPARRNCLEAIRTAPEGFVVTIAKPKRSTVKNAEMWAILTQLEPIDWYGQKLTKDEWKVVITASLKSQRAVPGVDGGFVVLGEQTRDMPAEEINLIILAAEALAGQHGIQIQRVEKSEPQGRVA